MLQRTSYRRAAMTDDRTRAIAAAWAIRAAGCSGALSSASMSAACAKTRRRRPDHLDALPSPGALGAEQPAIRAALSDLLAVALRVLLQLLGAALDAVAGQVFVLGVDDHPRTCLLAVLATGDPLVVHPLARADYRERDGNAAEAEEWKPQALCGHTRGQGGLGVSAASDPVANSRRGSGHVVKGGWTAGTGARLHMGCIRRRRRMASLSHPRHG